MHAGATASLASVTWSDFIARDDEDDPRELLDGELVEIEMPKELHEWICAQLIAHLAVWARTQGGRVLGSGYKIRISTRQGFMPDVQFYRKGNLAAVGQQNGLEEGHPDLVIEVISSSSRKTDRIVKLAGYASIGVPEYWLIDPEARSVERLLLAEGNYRIAQTAVDDDTFEPSSFEGLAVALHELWELNL